MRTMVYVFVGMYVLVALIGGTADMMGGHAEHWWQSYAKGFGYGILPGLFFIGPVTMFWLVNRSQLLAVGNSVHVLVRGSNAAVLWAQDVLITGRIR